MLYKRALLAICLLLFTWSAAQVHAQDDVAAQVLARINHARAQAGVPPLTRSAQLDAAAQGQANDMQAHGVGIGHRGADGSTMQERIRRAGYAFSAVGENWAAYRTLDKTFEFWLNDPPHRRNILHTKFTEIGIGIVPRANGGWIIVTDFGAPGNAVAEAAVAQPTAPRKAKKPRATATRAKPAAPKPTRAPTPKPARKPTRVLVAQVAPTPLPPPTRAAMVNAVPQPKTYLLRARGRNGRIVLQAYASSKVGSAQGRGDIGRMASGAALALGGMFLLGIALVGYRSSRQRMSQVQ